MASLQIPALELLTRLDSIGRQRRRGDGKVVAGGEAEGVEAAGEDYEDEDEDEDDEDDEKAGEGGDNDKEGEGREGEEEDDWRGRNRHEDVDGAG